MLGVSRSVCRSMTERARFEKSERDFCRRATRELSGYRATAETAADNGDVDFGHAKAIDESVSS